MDTSAALKLVIEEPESMALAEAIDMAEPALVACRLLETEMRRAAQREIFLRQDHVTAFLDGIDLYEMPAPLFRQAGLLPGSTLRPLDALHLAAAIALDVDAIATYDTRLSDASRKVGLDVVQPGWRDRRGASTGHCPAVPMFRHSGSRLDGGCGRGIQFLIRPHPREAAGAAGLVAGAAGLAVHTHQRWHAAYDKHGWPLPCRRTCTEGAIRRRTGA